jgi:hypothetical protein
MVEWVMVLVGIEVVDVSLEGKKKVRRLRERSQTPFY